jgi:EpsI family protein
MENKKEKSMVVFSPWFFFSVLPIVGMMYCYFNTLRLLVDYWISDSANYHHLIIPFVSAYIIWIHRRDLEELHPKPHYFVGMPILIFGLIILSIGTIAGVNIILYISLLVTLFGIMALLLGKSYYKIIWFPLGYLVFMLPFWSFVRPSLYMPLQLVSAKIAVFLLEIIGIPAYHNGIYIDLPNIKLVVAEACSGARYLFSVIAVVFAASYLFISTWRKRILLIFISVSVSILSNGLRVALISLFSYYNIGGDIHGPYHILYGSLVSTVGFIAIFIGVAFLKDHPLDLKRKRIIGKNVSDVNVGNILSRYKFASLSGLALFIFVGSYLNFYEPKPVFLKYDLQNIPYVLDGWEGKKTETFYKNFRESGADIELSRKYVSTTGENLYVYIAYFELQKQGKELINYRTEDLDLDKKNMYIIAGGDKKISISKVHWKNGNNNMTILYWYYVDGKIITNKYLAKLYLAYDGLIRRKTNGAVVMFLIERNEKNNSPDVPDKIMNFIHAIFPVLSLHLEV